MLKGRSCKVTVAMSMWVIGEGDRGKKESKAGGDGEGKGAGIVPLDSGSKEI